MNVVGSPTGKMLRKEASYLPVCRKYYQEGLFIVFALSARMTVEECSSMCSC